MSRIKNKTNNAKDARKVSLRTDNISIIADKNVIELFCGKGFLYDNVYIKSKTYIGVDIKKHKNNIVSDANEYVKKNDLSNYDIIDIDPYGNPYEVLFSINKIKDKTTFFITDGIYTDLSMGNVCKSIRMILDFNVHRVLKANRIHLLLIKQILQKFAEKHNSQISNFVIFTGKTASRMKYYTFTVTCTK